ncbi:MAG: flagellar biosynthesis anti-sigma factor FlgM [Fibrobacteria bacterium]|nr:flagellar biosynthesis anti-sigma factor FlgM [Fibrobacteria bacterium]
METGKIQQIIAQKLFYKSSKLPEELQKGHDKMVDTDNVSLSKEAASYAQIKSKTTEYEANRELHFQSVKKQVQSGNYQLDKEVMAKIADKIVSSLL